MRRVLYIGLFTSALATWSMIEPIDGGPGHRAMRSGLLPLDAPSGAGSGELATGPTEALVQPISDRGGPRVFSPDRPLLRADPQEEPETLASAPQDRRNDDPATTRLRPPNVQSIKPTSDEARRDLVVAINRELVRVGCLRGDVGETWGGASRKAMKAFIDDINARLPTGDPDFILLTLLQGHAGAACGSGCGGATGRKCRDSAQHAALANRRSPEQQTATHRAGAARLSAPVAASPPHQPQEPEAAALSEQAARRDALARREAEAHAQAERERLARNREAKEARARQRMEAEHVAAERREKELAERREKELAARQRKELAQRAARQAALHREAEAQNERERQAAEQQRLAALDDERKRDLVHRQAAEEAQRQRTAMDLASRRTGGDQRHESLAATGKVIPVPAPDTPVTSAPRPGVDVPAARNPGLLPITRPSPPITPAVPPPTAAAADTVGSVTTRPKQIVGKKQASHTRQQRRKAKATTGVARAGLRYVGRFQPPYRLGALPAGRGAAPRTSSPGSLARFRGAVFSNISRYAP